MYQEKLSFEFTPTFEDFMCLEMYQFTFDTLAEARERLERWHDSAQRQKVRSKLTPNWLATWHNLASAELAVIVQVTTIQQGE